MENKNYLDYLTYTALDLTVGKIGASNRTLFLLANKKFIKKLIEEIKNKLGTSILGYKFPNEENINTEMFNMAVINGIEFRFVVINITTPILCTKLIDLKEYGRE